MEAEEVRAIALAIQREEMTEYHVYTQLAKICKDTHNAGVLRKVGEAEKTHAAFWQSRTGVQVKPDRFKVFTTVITARILGLSFTLKQMEKKEGTASKSYLALTEQFPEVLAISLEEAEHERELLSMLNEERLQYAGSIVLGLNDALVELTGALAGFTLALGETRTISMAALVTGISAAFSMAASEYLSCKADNDPRAMKSALYTGTAYIITVMLLILPFLLIPNKYAALGITLAAGVFIIFLFNYYLATAKDLDFKRRFGEMTLISLAVAALSFGVGWVLKNILGVDG
ncbi:VIT1/CCC1 transporter family protein [Treponema primitia]|uniref:VIT1/CCC1 transporter family protein n=1 Tax=Treponema primitia TaxID=88058 RepID=UPI000255564F|nr:VIT1/CCC1 family protein [Treponema primitia]